MNKMEDIFKSLQKGEMISAEHPQRKLLREAAYDTIKLVQQINNSSDPGEINTLLSEITGRPINESVAVFPPVYINYGKDLTIGKNVFINFNCTILGLGGVEISDNVMIGPGVKILSKGHPVQAEERGALIPGKIYIGKNVWIGAGATILPGVHIGENAVIAAGALVTKDVPANSVVAGIPARLTKSINPKNQ